MAGITAHTTLALLLTMSTTACFSQDDQDTCSFPEPKEVVDSGTHFQYVVNTIDLPESSAEAHEFGFNLDGDEQGRPDNAMGSVLSVIASLGDYDLDTEVKALIDVGAILHLIDVNTASLNTSANVTVTIRHGRDTDGDASDNFSGTETFEVDDAKGSGVITGVIIGDTISVELGTVPLAISFPGLDEPFILQLTAATLDGHIDANGIEGRIGGVLSQQEIDDTLIPLLASGLSRTIARDCQGSVCEVDSLGELLLEEFDKDGDNQVSTAELRDNSITQSLLYPDVDVFQEQGRYSQLCDGVKESLSVGVGFTAVAASF